MDQGPQSVTLRTRGRVQTVAEFSDIVVREKDGHPVRIGDVARVEDGEADAETRRQRQRRRHRAAAGPPAVGHQHRRGGAATSEERSTELKAGAAGRLQRRAWCATPRSSSKRRFTTSRSTSIVGSILAALVVLLFLTNLRSTIISAIAIPTSIIATFGLVWYMGFTLNLMTMLALTLSVGIVIDDAIVVLENIYRFIEEKHEDQFQAAVDATQEIGLAVLATTLSLVAIFVPVGFMGGIVGRFMKSFGLTMAFAIMVSLLVSFTLTPMLSARWLKVEEARQATSTRRRTRSVFHAIDVFYTRMLEWAMAHRAIVAGVAVLVLLSSVPLFMIAQQELHAAGRPVGVRGQPARARGHQPRVDRGDHQPRRQRDARSSCPRWTTRW